jgi:TonB family protein
MLRWDETAWLTFSASAALKSTVVLALAWGITKLLRSCPAAWRHLVWTAAVAAVLALPFLSLGLPELRVPVNLPSLTFRANVTGNTNAEARPRSVVSPDAAATGRPAHSAPRQPDWPLYLMGLWAAGTALALARMASATVAMARLRTKARPVEDEEFSSLFEGLGIGRAVPLLEGAPGSVPMTSGPLHPAIFLPPDAARWTDERRRMVVLHELAHVRRGDVATHLLARTALSFYWWNPLAWLAWREFLKERERAADDLVLRAGARASDYASHLLAVAQAMRSPTATGWAAVGMARPSELEGRLLAILDSGVKRGTIGRATAAAAAVAAVVLVAPFAAIHAQNQNGAALAPDVDATIRAALAQKDHVITDNAAEAFEKVRQYETARRLLETSLAIREQTSGQQSEEYGVGLARLGDLAERQHQTQQAIGFFSQAVVALGDRPPAVHPLLTLGALSLDRKDYPKAEEYFERAAIADPSKSALALTGLALTHESQEGGAAAAESYYRQALAAETPDSPDAAATMDLLARLLKTQGSAAETDRLTQESADIRKTAAVGVKSKIQAAGASGVYHAGGGVTPPSLLQKWEPDYSELARVAKYQGTVQLYVEIGPDGLAHHIQVVRGLGLGLDDKAVEAINDWKFKPGMKDGQAVTVAATIEVNFRLL